MPIVVTVILMVLSWRISALVGLFAHEMAHACVGRLVGLRIREIRIGEGRTLIDRRIGETRLRIGWLWRGGTVRPHPNFKAGRIARCLFVAAGPLANLALLFALIWIMASGALERDWIVLVLPAAACQLATLRRTVLPAEHMIFGRRIANDGRVILAIEIKINV